MHAYGNKSDFVIVLESPILFCGQNERFEVQWDIIYPLNFNPENVIKMKSGTDRHRTSGS